MSPPLNVYPMLKHRVVAKYVVLDGIVKKTQRRHDVGPKESCDEQDTAADYEGSDVAPGFVKVREPTVNTIPYTLPIADFEYGVD